MLDAKAIILVGARDFGRCPLASRLPTALWPVLGRPVLERLLASLADQGIRRAVVCSNGQGQMLAETINADERLKLTFYDELLPDGTAGCIRDAADGQSDELMIILPAHTMCPPKIGSLIEEHNRGGGHLTVMLNPCLKDNSGQERASGIYICNSSVLEHIPPVGYFDMKEGLIPELLSAGKTIHAAELPYDPGNFRHSREYLRAIGRFLESAPSHCGDLPPREKSGLQDVCIAANARVDSGARIYGRAVIMDGATVAAGAVVLGPAVIECNATVSRDAVIAGSVLWAGARAGPNCRIQSSVIDQHAVVPGNRMVRAGAITDLPQRGIEPRAAHGGVRALATGAGAIARAVGTGKGSSKNLNVVLQPSSVRAGRMLPEWARLNAKPVLVSLALSFVSISFIWSYGPGLADLWRLWSTSDEYSSGLLVPILAGYVLWSRRNDIAQCPFRPSAWGLVAFVFAQLIRFLGLFLMYGSAERFSMVLTIAALTLLLAGTQFTRKVLPILVFLCLMLPWPHSIQNHVGLRLQTYATSSAVFCLEVIGYRIVADGHIIHIGDVSVAVAEACNGLRMITAFFVISGLVVLLVDREWWEKLIVLISSLPIALVCNTVRLVLTAIFFTVLEGEYWEDVFHDFGGYAMMPLALAAVVGELWLLTRLTTLPVDDQAIIITRQRGSGTVPGHAPRK